MRAGKKVINFLFAFLLFAGFSSTSLAGTSWKFITVGDSRGSDNGVNTAILGEIAAEIVNKGVDFVILPGDLVNGSANVSTMTSQLTTWRDTMQPVYSAGIDVYACRGNHENYGVTAWNNVFTGVYSLPDNGPAGEQNLTYSVTHKNSLIIGLDQYVNLHRVNQTWLDSQLSANTNPHIFAFGHEPAFKANHSDCLDDYPVNRDVFWASLKNAGGRIYFAGHDHFYDHAHISDGDGDAGNDIHQYIVGTGGAPFHDWSPPYDGVNSGMSIEQLYHAKQYGYVLGEIDGLNATLTWMERVSAGAYTAGEVWSYTAVPEPATAILLALGGLALLRNRRTTEAELKA